MTDERDSFWIRTEPTIDGSAFVVTLSITEDHAVTLTPARANQYAGALLGAAAEAEYDAAIVRQMTERLSLDMATTAQLIRDMRAERPTRIAAGLVFEPGVSQRKQHAFIRIVRDEQAIGQLDVPAARRHALHVLEAVPVADLDAAYLKVLRGIVGTEENTARQVIEDIDNYRPSWGVSDE